MQEQQKARFLVNKVTLLYIHAYLEIYKVNPRIEIFHKISETIRHFDDHLTITRLYTIRKRGARVKSRFVYDTSYTRVQ